jgi:hypothetical protein
MNRAAGAYPNLNKLPVVERHQGEEPFVDLLGNWLLAPRAQLADYRRNHVEATPAAGYLQQVKCPVEDGCCLFDLALVDVREGQVPEDDRLGLVTILVAANHLAQGSIREQATQDGMGRARQTAKRLLRGTTADLWLRDERGWRGEGLLPALRQAMAARHVGRL